jgi:hypothetical protein
MRLKNAIPRSMAYFVVGSRLRKTDLLKPKQNLNYQNMIFKIMFDFLIYKKYIYRNTSIASKINKIREGI